MKDKKRPVAAELSIELILGILLVLYPYGADQMGLPHNFWVGVCCWIAATALGVRMFWIFPLRSWRLTTLEKGLVSFIALAAFALVFRQPVLDAYHRQGAPHAETAGAVSAAHRAIPPVLSNDQPVTPPKAQSKTKKPQKTSAPAPSVSSSGNNSPAIGTITQGDRSALSINQSGGVTAGTIVTYIRSLTDDEKAQLVTDLKKSPPGIVTVAATESGQQLGEDVYQAFHDAGWQMQENEVQSTIGFKGQFNVDIAVFPYGTPAPYENTSDPVAINAINSIKALKRFKTGWGLSDTIKPGTFKIQIGPPQKSP